MLRVSVANPYEYVLEFSRLKDAARAVLEGEGVAACKVTLAFVDNAHIHRLNKQFLSHDEPTDVLTFPYTEPGAKSLEGEVVIGYEVAKEYAADPTRKWPLVLFLHGAGERGTNLALVTKHGPPKLVAAGREFPFILVSPQCPEGQIWDDDALMALLNQLENQLSVDVRHVVATGLSMGGYGTWSLASKHPEHFAAVAPVCGGGERIRTLLPTQREALKTIAVWAFHGAKDNVVPLAESERMVEAFKKAGVTDLQFTIYPDDGHDSWTHAYNEPTFYDWLLKPRR